MHICNPAYPDQKHILFSFEDRALKITAISDLQLHQLAHGKAETSQFSAAKLRRRITDRESVVLLRGHRADVSRGILSHADLEQIRDLGCFIFQSDDDVQVNGEDPNLICNVSKAPKHEAAIDVADKIMPEEYYRPENPAPRNDEEEKAFYASLALAS